VTPVERLPLWAQVLLACRTAWRAAATLPPGAERDALERTCRALQEGCFGGGERDWHRALLADVRALPPDGAAEPVRASLEAALDAAFAAESALDFSAAQTACTTSTLRAIGEAGRAPGLTPLQVQILVASDVDLLGFACGEADADEYEPLPRAVLGRLTPVP
jgi:hypothetical protein